MAACGAKGRGLTCVGCLADGIDEDKLGDYEFVVPEEPKTWRT
jgi:hypothetical protein